MFVLLFLFSLQGLSERNFKFWEASCHPEELSPMQVKQPKKHDSYNKLIPYISSPIPCVYIIILKQCLHCRNFLLLHICTTSKRAGCCHQSVTSPTACGRWTYMAASSHSFCHGAAPHALAGLRCISPTTLCSHLGGLLSRQHLDRSLRTTDALRTTSWSWSERSKEQWQKHLSLHLLAHLLTSGFRGAWMRGTHIGTAAAPALGNLTLGSTDSCPLLAYSFNRDSDIRLCHPGRRQRLWYESSGTNENSWQFFASITYFRMYTCAGVRACTGLPFKSVKVSKYRSTMGK